MNKETPTFTAAIIESPDDAKKCVKCSKDMKVVIDTLNKKRWDICYDCKKMIVSKYNNTEW
jgi:hypothetical protein